MPLDTPRSSAGLADIERAVAILRDGGLVAYPTDTVYGLAALPTDDQAVARLFEAKKRALDRAVPLLIASPADVALAVDEVPEVARRLMRAFWPGALTIVFRTAADFRSAAVDRRHPAGWRSCWARRSPAPARMSRASPIRSRRTTCARS